jgi:phosphoglycerate kinase
MLTIKSLDGVVVTGQRVLVRADLNVPMSGGEVADVSRLERLAPTILELADNGARVIILSHFDRPDGKVVPEMSLLPVATALSNVLGRKVAFAENCIGPDAARAIEVMVGGDILVLENTRFHAGEEANDPEFAAELAKLGDIYVNDAFSSAHRAHASTEAIAKLLPAYPGRLMQAEMAALQAALGKPERPVAAIVAGSKVSTKIALLENLVGKVDVLFIGGAMANTFLAAQGFDVGASLQEKDFYSTALKILETAKKHSCEVLLPVDLTIAPKFAANVETKIVAVGDAIPAGWMALDVGPATVQSFIVKLTDLKTVIWNGPVGAFETKPFDAATNALAAAIVAATERGEVISVGGGGDTVSALKLAGASEGLTYLSSAGGAFLEWMEGKILPGVEALSAGLSNIG